MRDFDWLPVAAAVFAARFIAGEALFEHASRRGDTTVFRPVLGLRILFGIGIPFLLYETPQVVRIGGLFDVMLGLIVGVGGATAAFLFWTGTILVDSSSIRETRWFGLKRTRIPWSEVQFAGNDVENTVTIRSKDDKLIKHTQYHVDRAGFIEALKQYCPACSYNQPTYKPWVPLGAG